MVPQSLDSDVKQSDTLECCYHPSFPRFPEDEQCPPGQQKVVSRTQHSHTCLTCYPFLTPQLFIMKRGNVNFNGHLNIKNVYFLIYLILRRSQAKGLCPILSAVYICTQFYVYFESKYNIFCHSLTTYCSFIS